MKQKHLQSAVPRGWLCLFCAVPSISSLVVIAHREKRAGRGDSLFSFLWVLLGPHVLWFWQSLPFIDPRAPQFPKGGGTALRWKPALTSQLTVALTFLSM